MDPLEDLSPATATQILHDEHQNSKPTAETTNPTNHNNKNTALLKTVNTTSVMKNKNQSSISDLVMLTKGKNESDNNNTETEGQDGNDKNTIYNRRIEHATTATIDNNRFTTKCTLDIRPEKKNEPINSPKIHQFLF